MLDVVTLPFVHEKLPSQFHRQSGQQVRIGIQVVEFHIGIAFAMLDSRDVVEVRNERPRSLPVIHASENDVFKADCAATRRQYAVIIKHSATGGPTSRRDIVVEVREGLVFDKSVPRPPIVCESQDEISSLMKEIGVPMCVDAP